MVLRRPGTWGGGRSQKCFPGEPDEPHIAAAKAAVRGGRELLRGRLGGGRAAGTARQFWPGLTVGTTLH